MSSRSAIPRAAASLLVAEKHFSDALMAKKAIFYFCARFGTAYPFLFVHGN
jgi:hypothetical protein